MAAVRASATWTDAAGVLRKYDYSGKGSPTHVVIDVANDGEMVGWTKDPAGYMRKREADHGEMVALELRYLDAEPAEAPPVAADAPVAAAEITGADSGWSLYLAKLDMPALTAKIVEVARYVVDAKTPEIAEQFRRDLAKLRAEYTRRTGQPVADAEQIIGEVTDEAIDEAQQIPTAPEPTGGIPLGAYDATAEGPLPAPTGLQATFHGSTTGDHTVPLVRDPATGGLSATLHVPESGYTSFGAVVGGGGGGGGSWPVPAYTPPVVQIDHVDPAAGWAGTADGPVPVPTETVAYVEAGATVPTAPLPTEGWGEGLSQQRGPVEPEPTEPEPTEAEVLAMIESARAQISEVSTAASMYATATLDVDALVTASIARGEVHRALYLLGQVAKYNSPVDRMRVARLAKAVAVDAFDNAALTAQAVHS